MDYICVTRRRYKDISLIMFDKTEMIWRVHEIIEEPMRNPEGTVAGFRALHGSRGVSL